MTKTLMLSAAAAAFLLAGGGAAWADCPFDNTTTSLCGHNQNQIDNGFTCEVCTTSVAVTRTIAQGGNPKCQSGNQTTTIWIARNQNNVIQEDKSGEQAGDTEWFGPPANGACP